jgi:hypothetical protein
VIRGSDADASALVSARRIGDVRSSRTGTVKTRVAGCSQSGQAPRAVSSRIERTRVKGPQKRQR